MATKNIILACADITTIAVDAMVNSANKSMLAGSGLCGVIHKKAGEELTQDCEYLYQQKRAYEIGTALVTPAGKLPAQHVIHAVGPKWYETENKEQELLKVYANIFEVADELLQVKTLSIPTLSTGIHKYPAKFAAGVVLPYLIEKLSACKNLESVIIACGNHENALAYQEVAAQLSKGEVQVINLMPSSLQA